MRICRGPPPPAVSESESHLAAVCFFLCGGRGTVLQQLWEHHHSFISVSRSLQRKGDRLDKRQEVPAILRGGWELDESREGEGSVQRGVISHFVNATACSDVWAGLFFFH